jgi:hypothetical protein
LIKLQQPLERVFRKLFMLDQWNIGIAHCSLQSFLQSGNLREVHWLPEDAYDYRADPFVIRYENRLNCFYEEYNWNTDCGVLKCIRLDQPEVDSVTVHLEGLESCHLSYPYVFVCNGSAYLVPESSELKEIALYKATRFPNQWRKVTTVAKGERFVDSSLFYYDERYWVISSVSGREGLIYVFVSESPETAWSPHLLNPIAVETNATRGAGRIFCHEGIWYRPTQVVNGEYGSAIQMNRIRFSVTSFEQCAAFNMGPIKPYTYGIHNIDVDVNSGRIVIDGKQYFKTLYAPIAKTLGRLRRCSRVRNQRSGL